MYKKLFFKPKMLRKFSTTTSLQKLSPKNNVKAKTASSHDWLTRQLTDPYVEKAKLHNYRCRSAFKLLEINERFNLLQPGKVIVDCGAAPGSWTQVAVKCVNSDGKDPDSSVGTVVSVDRQPFFPVEGALILGNADFTTNETQTKLKELLNGRKPDVVLSDMAPIATGVKQLDKENIVSLCYSVLRFAVLVSCVDSSLLVKLWQCGERERLEKDIARFYKSVKVVKPNASRSDSAEIFLLGRGFKGLEISNKNTA